MITAADLLIPEPTNAERDADPMRYGKRDNDARWNKYPQVRVEIQSAIDFEDDTNPMWAFRVTLDDGRFIVGTDYRTRAAARKACEIAINRGLYRKPALHFREAKRAEVFGKIGTASPKLAAFLEEWTKKNS